MNTATKANTITYVAIDRLLINEVVSRHSTQPAGLFIRLFRRARHTVVVIVLLSYRQPPAGRISTARPAL